MDLIIPHIPMNVTSNNIAASSEPLWAVGTAYTTGDVVRYTPAGSTYEHEFKAKQDHTGQTPIARGSVYWIDLGTTNQNRLFDGLNNSRSVADDPSGNIEVEIVLSKRVQTLHLLGLRDVESATVTQSVDGVVMHTHTSTLATSTTPVGFWSWLFGERVFASSYAVRLAGVYKNQTINVTLTGVPNAQCAQVLIGNSFYIGCTETGASPRLQSFSGFTPNDFGVYQFTPRQSTRQGRYTVWVDTNRIDYVYQLMERYEQNLVLLDANNASTNFDALRAYGKIVDFSPGITYDQTAFDIRIEGLH